MIAVSRTSTNAREAHDFNSERASSVDRTGVVCSGTVGGFIRSIGEASSSPSSTSQLNSCCRARNRTLAVAGDFVSSR